ncbi:MAG: PQQ-like beta-propeller repeat protein [Verrucomicrobia bacterium]|nr:PQQ-like beta-propeller repeat protein [Verrucomicrobiota bacterium]
MKYPVVSCILVCLGALILAVRAEEWSRFRGPNGSGVIDAKNLPDKTDDSNTVWKVETGTGWSSPVLFGNKIALTAETGAGKRAVICLDAASGKELWRHEESFVEHKKHNFNSFASSTPFMDAERIYVNWSNGTAIQALALDHDGKVLWHNDHVADYIHEHGTGASPVVVDGIMIVRSEFASEKEGKDLTTSPEQKEWKSCIVGLDVKTGAQKWKLPLPNCLNTYSTPLVHDLPGGKHEFICVDTGSGVMGIDTTTGKINWQHNPGYKQRSLGSPAFKDGMFFCTLGIGGGGKETVALDLTSGKPKLMNLTITKSLPYVPTPLVVGDYLYLLGDGGILKCVEFKTGKEIYEERLNGSKGSSKFFSSPVAADGKIFCGSQMGDLIIVKAGPKFEQLSASKLDSPINATPAIANNHLYIRTEKSLYCVGAKVQLP